MSDTVTLRVTIDAPVPGVALAVQQGRAALVPPVRVTSEAVTFEVRAEVRVRPDGTIMLAGAEVHGPPAGRFLYVTVGTRAGQPDSPWNRRAKVPLSGIPADLLMAARAHSGVVLAARMAGRAKDGGPACATVPLLDEGWRLQAADV
jgi:hypothetical protein